MRNLPVPVTLQQNPLLIEATRTSCSCPRAIPHSGLHGMIQKLTILEDAEVKQIGFLKEWEIKAVNYDNRAIHWIREYSGEQNQDTAGISFSFK